MGIVALEGFGSGGAALNFKVVPGLTQPGTASENTIWVNTDQKIARWVFSATKPNVVSVVENAGTVLGAIGGRTYSKANNGKAAVAFVFDGNYTGPMLVSTEPDACVFSTSGDYVSNNGAEGTVVYNGKTYYYSSGSWMGGDWTQWFAHSMSANSHADAALLIAECWESKMTNGTVWFLTGTSSQVEFDALKKNIIQIYPISAKQFVGDDFVDVGVKSYQNGMWNEWVKPWDGKLYESGNEFATVTGGWSSDGYTYAGKTSAATTKNSNNMFMQGETDRAAMIGTAYPIDLSGVNTIYVDWQGTSHTGTYSLVLAVLQDKNAYATMPQLGFGVTGTRRTDAYDVSAYNGSYYVVVMAAWAPQCAGYVYNVWCE